jgi:hypothetical protein
MADRLLFTEIIAHLLKSATYEAPHYTVFYIFSLLSLSLIHIFSSPPISNIQNCFIIILIININIIISSYLGGTYQVFMAASMKVNIWNALSTR